MQVDFYDGQISSGASPLPLRAFGQRHTLALRLADHVSELGERERVHHR